MSENNAQFPLEDSAQRVQSTTSGGAVGRNKVVLAPGHSPLDWARIKQTSKQHELTGGLTHLQKYTLADVQKHKTVEDAWTVVRGKVFNISRYLPFHPGGVPMLMSVAGKDGTVLFEKYHHWVNTDYLLDKCLVGFLVF